MLTANAGRRRFALTATAIPRDSRSTLRRAKSGKRSTARWAATKSTWLCRARTTAGRWPLASYGINYDGRIITENLAVAGTRQPVSYWAPSIAVCGTRFCVGDEFPRWRNCLLVGALAHEELRRLVIAEGRVIHQDVLLKSAGRVRDVACDPSGAVYAVLNNPHMVLKLTNQGRALRQ
ncbi:MAG: hypothetical protein CMJ58_03415 [Planctomycetaceae bacterium]|nr:hypothetical protein [Planctomycetaceae bacterium]